MKAIERDMLLQQERPNIYEVEERVEDVENDIAGCISEVKMRRKMINQWMQ